MLWPFNHFRKSPAPLRGTIEAIYGMIVAQAREPLFYRSLGVADTVNSRFDMVVLHLWMVFRELKKTPATDPLHGLSQALFDHFCSDMDHNLREMGTADLRVPKRMAEFGRAFYGRAAAYDTALAEGVDALAQSLSKNVYNGADLANARRLADYVENTVTALASVDAKALVAGWKFPVSLVASVPES